MRLPMSLYPICGTPLHTLEALGAGVLQALAFLPYYFGSTKKHSVHGRPIQTPHRCMHEETKDVVPKTDPWRVGQ